MTYLQAAVTILSYADRPLTVGELTAVAVAQNLVRPRGRTPDRSMSSVLYRRMAADPDAPIMAAGGRFWLRGRPLPVEGGLALRPAIRQVRRKGSRRGEALSASLHERAPRRSTLPAPPMHIPLDLAALAGTADSAWAASGMGQRERAVARLASRLSPLAERLAPLWPAAPEWEAERTLGRLVAPLLTLLGYRRSDQRPAATVRGRAARVLLADGAPTLLLEVTRPAHILSDADARATLARARVAGVPWVLLSNGHELRLYSTRISGSTADPGRALILRVEPHGWSDEVSKLDAARQLWLLSRDAVAAGSLDAYLAARAVGAALLATLDDSRSPLVDALCEAVRAATGLELSSAVLARQARLAVRGRRGRDGEPLPADIPAVAAILSTLPAGMPERDEEVHAAS